MKKIAALLAAVQFALIASPSLAQPNVDSDRGRAGVFDTAAQSGEARPDCRETTTYRWVEEWDPHKRQWVRISESVVVGPRQAPTQVAAANPVAPPAMGRAAARYAQSNPTHEAGQLLGQYGPFVVTSPTRAAMVGHTDSSTPRLFDAMMRDFPQLEVLEMVEAPGTDNDIANLAVGRRIRAAGLATYVPRGGSVRSGAVELFLAGVERQIDDGAEFAVHSWLDNHGREADDFAADDPAHRLYLDYYVEMGMTQKRASDFYAMTNSVPHSQALWLVADDMRYWLRPVERSEHGERAHVSKRASERAKPVNVKIAYSDVSGVSLAQLSMNRIALAQLDSRLAFP